ncbi:MAG: cysteine synthase A [Clostridia bacterium]|nr:cysteine synthase A [Clostridia bacterium]
MKIYENIGQLIGKTPLLRVNNLIKENGLQADILVKLEYFNPAGSAKDRVALNMLDEAEKSGKLKNGTVIIEPTSGNTGVGLAAVAASRGCRAVLVMPETMSVERRKLLAAYGAEIVLTDGEKGMAGAIEKAEQLHRETPGSIIAGQFVNPSNPAAHYASTGPEIWEDTDGKVDIFVAGIGTGGTVTGTGKYLKEKNPEIKVVGFEPFDSPLITAGTAGGHKLQGIGANFIPEILDMSVIDEVMTVKTEEAYAAAQALARKEGIFTGVTSGAALFSAIELAKREENRGKTIVALLPDTGERYLSTEDFI